MKAIKEKTNQKLGIRITVGLSNFCRKKKIEPVAAKSIR